MWKRLAMIFVIALAGNVSASNCTARGKVVAADIQNGNVILTLQIYANGIPRDRTVFFSIFGKVRVNASFGSTIASITKDDSVTINSGEEFSEVEVEIWPGPFGPPVGDIRISSILIKGCYVQ